MTVSRGRALAMLGSFAALPVAARAASSTPAPETYDPAALREEALWLRDTLVDVGAKPFAYCDQARWLAAYDAFVASIDAPLGVWQFYLRTGPQFAALNDGHVSVGVWTIFKRLRDAGLLGMPLSLQLRQSGVFVDAQSSDEVPEQSEVLSINGLSAREFSDAVIALVGGQHTVLRYDFSSAYVNPYAYIRFGEIQRYAFRIRRPDGATSDVVVPALTRADLTAKIRTYAKTESDPPDYSFRRLPGGAGLIDYRACRNYAAFSKFLKTTFGEIKAEPITGLIVDIRENGGGNSDLNDLLWSYVTTKPFAQFGGTMTKVSDRIRKQYAPEKYAQIYGVDAMTAPAGSVLTVHDDAPRTPAPNLLRYHGPVYLLIGSHTFSSAESCACAAKDFGLATIVGEETAEPVNSTGEVYAGLSPLTGLDFAFTTKYFFGPKPHPDGEGVIPDVRIVTTDEDRRRGVDPVMAYAVHAIAARSGRS